MKWLEIIELRTSDKNSEIVFNELTRLIDEVNQERKHNKVKLYYKAHLKTDYSIHIVHDLNEVDQRGSTLGLYITSQLKAFGLVNHNLWIKA